MSKSPELARDVLALVFQGTPLPAAYGEAIFVSLHIAEPSDQASNEASYKGYRRALTKRSTAAWKASGGAAARVENAELIVFPLSTGADKQDITHFGLGLKERGAGRLLYAAPLKSALVVGRNIEPRFPPGALAIIEA